MGRVTTIAEQRRKEEIEKKLIQGDVTSLSKEDIENFYKDRKDVFLLSKEDLIYKLSEIARESTNIENEKNKQKNQMINYEQQLIQIENKYKKVELRQKKLNIFNAIFKIFKILTTICLWIFYLAIFGAVMSARTWGHLKSEIIQPIIIVIILNLIKTNTVKNKIIEFIFIKKWNEFDDNQLRDLLDNDEQYQDIKRKYSKIRWDLPFFDVKRKDIHEEINLSPRYYGWEGVLATILLNNRADTLKEAINVLEEDWHKNRLLNEQQNQTNKMNQIYHQQQNLYHQQQTQINQLHEISNELDRLSSDVSYLQYK